MAVAALGLSACNDDKLVPDNGNADGKFVTVHFGAEAAIEGATKATLTTEDEKTFKSAWVDGDVLSVKYSNDNRTAGATTSGVVSATWATDHFEAELPKYRGVWFYDALYPAPNAEKKVDFGSARTQNGSDYNSKYDLMKGGAIAENADAGKTADGQNIVFNMTRQTAIAYFHLASALDEEVVSAKLSVEGNGAYLSTSDVQIGKDNKGNTSYAQGYAFTETEGVASKEISLTFTGIAPKTSDFKLWFNVLPTIYDKMTLTVETANHTLTISRNATGMYEAGKLYKVVKDNIPAEKWVSKAAYTGGDLVFDFKTIKPKGWPTTKEEANVAGTYKYAINGVDYNYLLGDGTYCGGTVPTSAYLMIAKGSSLGLPAIAGYKLVKVVGTLNDSGSPSKRSSISITDGTNEVIGGAAQTWDTMGSDYTYSLTETEENTVYYLSVSSTANCQMIKLVLSYEPATPSVTKYVVSFATVEGGSFSASPSKAEAGAEITLTATPAEGYAFNNDWSVKGADETVIEVVDGKFTMPAQNVTVSGSFSKVIPLPTCATPVITIAEGGVVSIACETPGATIHYTVGDTPADPTKADAEFSAFTLTDGQTIKAIAVAEGYKPSAVASKKYTVGGAEAVLVWDDDFSSITTANTKALSKLNGSKTGFEDAYTIVENCYPEVSSIKMSYSKQKGSLQTPKFTRLSGTSSVTVTIEYAGYGKDAGALNLSVEGNGTLSVQSLTATNTATSGEDVTTWDKATFVISGADKGTALKITSSAAKKRFFINSIKIEAN